MRAARQVIRLSIAIAIACLFLNWGGESFAGNPFTHDNNHCAIAVHLKSDPPGYFAC